MRLLVDELPEKPDACPFAEYVRVIDTVYLEELEANGDVEYCADCGGVVVDDDYTQDIFVCHITRDQCGIEAIGECDGMCVGYRMEF